MSDMQDILDKLGFSEYWDNNGTSGDRRLVMGEPLYAEGINSYTIEVLDEMEDVYEGYGAMSGSESEYKPETCIHKETRTEIHTLEDLLTNIKLYMPDEFYQHVKQILKQIKI